MADKNTESLASLDNWRVLYEEVFTVLDIEDLSLYSFIHSTTNHNLLI